VAKSEIGMAQTGYKFVNVLGDLASRTAGGNGDKICELEWGA
jgi:hypothetical protein